MRVLLRMGDPLGSPVVGFHWEVDRSASFSSFDLFHHLSTMLPLAASTPPPDLMINEIFLFLDRINRRSGDTSDDGFDVNPYQYDPSNLPDGAWFLVKKIEEKETKHGSWRAKGQSEIFANATISGRITTFEFFRVQAAIEQRTVWMMKEYRVTPQAKHDQTKSQDSALCKFFSLQNDPEPELNDLELAKLLSMFPSCNDGQRSIGEQVNSLTERPGSSLVDKARDQAVDDKVDEIYCILRGDYVELDDLTEGAGSSLVDKARDQAVDDKVDEIYCILRGDYVELDDLTEGAGSSLVDKSRDQAVDDKVDEIGDFLELDDLANAASHSSSSANSSCQSFKSDESFEFMELADLDDDKKEDLSGKGSTSNHIIMMCGIANDVVVQPAPLGFLAEESDNAAAKETKQAPDKNKSKSPIEPSSEKASKKLKAKHVDEGPSHARRATTSSSSSNDEPVRAARREEKRSKKLMKFLCFMPF